MIKFRFELEQSSERSAYIEKELSKLAQTNSAYRFSEKELEAIGSYILYGKDPDGTSTVDRGEVHIKPAHSTYASRPVSSIEELLEIPGYDERNFFQPIRYREPKVKFDREKYAELPGISELWARIDELDHQIRLATGKTEFQPGERLPDNFSLYRSKHLLVELRREQYTLKDIFRPVEFQFGENRQKQNLTELVEVVNWTLYKFYPLGLYLNRPIRFIQPTSTQLFSEEFDRPDRPKTDTIDFTNPEHLYLIVEKWAELSGQTLGEAGTTAEAILDTFTFYAGLAHLDQKKTIILERKKEHRTNEEIRQELEQKLGVTHTPNYISTIYKKNVCGEISEAVKLHYDYYLERDAAENFKKCADCGELKLRDPREFMRKSKSSDGLSNRCKECEKKIREKRKEA